MHSTLAGNIYFTTRVRKFGSVCVCPLKVVVNVRLYVPGGVAPFGPFARPPHAAVPSATSINTANVSATRRLRCMAHAIPPRPSDKSSSAIPPAGQLPGRLGANPVFVAPVQ